MEIGKIFNSLQKKFKSHKFSGISLNSKDCKKNDIFFALKGIKKNGNLYIEEAIKNGARTIVSDNKFQGYKKKVLYVHSKNPRKLITSTCKKIYKKIPKNIVAVTGTNGKSSVTSFYFQILKLNKKKVGSIGTLGIQDNKLILPTSNTSVDPILLSKVLNRFKNNQIDNVILEASSHGLKQHRLDSINVNIGIFTNLSRDHLDYHKSYKDYLNSKMILFKRLMKKKSNIIYDNEISQSNLLKKISNKNKLLITTIGNKNSDLNIIKHFYIGDKQLVCFRFKNKTYKFESNLIGKLQIKNLLMSILAAIKSNISMYEIVKKIKYIKPINGRLEKIGKIKNSSIVVLDYAHTPAALKASLESIRDQFKFRKVSLVFGCGGERDKPKRKIMGSIANKYCDKIFLTDDNPRSENPNKIRLQIKEKISKKKLIEIPSRKNAIATSILESDPGEIILIAGKGHEDYQEYLKKFKFSDKKYILKFIKIKNKILSNNWKTNIINNQLNKKKLKPFEANEASLNSKNIKKNNIFFGIKGKNKDGNKYADDALKNGASLSIVDKIYGKINSKKIKVKNSLNTLSILAKQIREISSIKSVAITGSSGKTSLKDMLGHSLNYIYPTIYSKKSFNNKYGVPLSLFNIKKKNIFGVFEVGMNKKGEIDSLTKMIQPDIGVITNISYAHIQKFKNLKAIANAKAEIMNNIISGGTVILNRDDKFYNYLKNIANQKNMEVISFGLKKSSNIFLIKQTNKKSYTIITVSINKKIKEFIIKNKQKAYILNILASIAVISKLVDISEVKKNIFYKYNLPKGRGDIFKIKHKKKSFFIIDESYNSNPASLKFALNNFNNLKIKSNRKFILIGDMLELGKFSKKLHKEAAQSINKSNIYKAYVYGKQVKETFNKIKTQKKGKHFTNKAEILNFMKNTLNNNDYLMIKGSNGTGLNKLVNKIKNRNINVI